MPCKGISLQCASQVERVKMLSCTWSGCDQSFPKPELTAHLMCHGKDSAQLFHAPSSCVWSGCTSKAIFKRLTAYKHHLSNIHVEPLICTVARCPHKKPFRDQDDLDRHSATSHSDVKNYHCPYDTCEAETRKFARKDKWLKHIHETMHGNDAFCPDWHCASKQASTSGGFKTRKEISRHFTSVHALNSDEGYECALGSCAKAMVRSHWSQASLYKHLRHDHGVELWPAVIALNDELVILMKHLDAFPQEKYHDCEVCSSMGMQEATQATASRAPEYQPFPSYVVDASTMAPMN
jgi:hypothetical protein